MKMFYILTVMMGTQILYAFVKTHQTTFKMGEFYCM